MNLRFTIYDLRLARQKACHGGYFPNHQSLIINHQFVETILRGVKQ